MNNVSIEVDAKKKSAFLAQAGGLVEDFDWLLSQAVDMLPLIASLISKPRELQSIVNALSGTKKIIAPKDRVFRPGDALLLVWNSGRTTNGIEDPIPVDLGIVMEQQKNHDLDMVVLGLLEISPLLGNSTYPPEKAVVRRPVYANSSVVLPLKNRRS